MEKSNLTYHRRELFKKGTFLFIIILYYFLNILWIKKLFASTNSKMTHTADEALASLIQGNAKFVKVLNTPSQSSSINEIYCNDLIQKKVLDRKQEFIKVRDEQSPKAIIIGCADSRVSPEIIFDEGIGSLFVIRLAGNFIEGAGHSISGSIEYAVTHLGVRLIIILGHQKCGAISAALEKILNPFNNSTSNLKSTTVNTSHDSIEPLEELITILKKNMNKNDIENTIITLSQSTANKDNLLDKLMNEAIRKNVNVGVEYLSKQSKYTTLLNSKGKDKLVIKGAIYSLDTGKVDFI